MFVLGVTGGIGSGKTTVSAMLRDRGARVLDADAIVRRLYSGGAVPAAIKSRFGPGMLDARGAVDRTALAEVVFQDESAREALEAIVHPAVRDEILAILQSWDGEGFAGIAVLDVPLLVESGFAYPVDALVVVVSPGPVRLARLEKRGVPRAEAERRMRAQATDETKRGRADYVLENDGGLEELESRVAALLKEVGRDEGS